MLSEAAFRKSLGAYGSGWIDQEPERTLALFTDDASYMYTPFHKIMHGKEEIRRYIKKGAAGLQQDIEFSYEILAVTEKFGTLVGKPR